MRKHKYGTLLMNRVETVMKSKNINTIMLTFDTHDHNLTKFYNKLGYIMDPYIQTYNKHGVFSKII